MAGGKGKSAGGKSSGGKTSAAEGPKKQQSHSARAGLQVRSYIAIGFGCAAIFFLRRSGLSRYRHTRILKAPSISSSYPSIYRRTRNFLHTTRTDELPWAISKVSLSITVSPRKFYYNRHLRPPPLRSDQICGDDLDMHMR